MYSRDADADRAFLRDVLGYPNVDAGGGWLIFKLPPAEVAVHPTDTAETHELYLMCDDLERTMEELRAKGWSSPIRSATRGGDCSRRSRCPEAGGSGCTSHATRRPTT